MPLAHRPTARMEKLYAESPPSNLMGEFFDHVMVLLRSIFPSFSVNFRLNRFLYVHDSIIIRARIHLQNKLERLLLQCAPAGMNRRTQWLESGIDSLFS